MRKGSGSPDPVIPEGVTSADLDKDVQAELYGLGKELSRDVGAHLAAVAVFIEDDPDRAYAHAVAARRRAARLGVVRETAGLAAYRAGRYTDALAELRTARRMTGSNEHLAVMADCERGMHRPERALELVRSPEAKGLSKENRIELAIVESGARADLGQLDAALVAVRLPELDGRDGPGVARLRFAYSEALRALGRDEEADDWRGRAFAADRDGSAGLAALADAADDEDFYDAFDDLGDDDLLDVVESSEADAQARDADVTPETTDDAGHGDDAEHGDGLGDDEGRPGDTGALEDEFDEPEVRANLSETAGLAGSTDADADVDDELEEYELIETPRPEQDGDQDPVRDAEAYADVAATEEVQHVRSVSEPGEQEDAEQQVQRAGEHDNPDREPNDPPA